MVRKGFKNLAIGMAACMMLSQSFPALAVGNTEGHWPRRKTEGMDCLRGSLVSAEGRQRNTAIRLVEKPKRKMVLLPHCP